MKDEEIDLQDQANRTEGPETVAVQTSRFGEVEVPASQVVHFPQGLLGFPADRYFVFLRHREDSPFLWLQSLANPNLAFVVMSPLPLLADYRVRVTNDDRRDLNLADDDSLLIYALVTIPKGNPAAMTVNLLGPIVINARARIGKQIVLNDTAYSHRQPILARTPAEEPAAPKRADAGAPS